MPGANMPKKNIPENHANRDKGARSTTSRKFIIQIHDCLSIDAKRQHGPENLRRLFFELTKYLHDNFTINGVISDEAYTEISKTLLPHVFIYINDGVLQDFVVNGGFQLVTAQILNQTVDGKPYDMGNNIAQ